MVDILRRMLEDKECCVRSKDILQLLQTGKTINCQGRPSHANNHAAAYITNKYPGTKVVQLFAKYWQECCVSSLLLKKDTWKDVKWGPEVRIDPQSWGFTSQCFSCNSYLAIFTPTADIVIHRLYLSFSVLNMQLHATRPLAIPLCRRR